MLRDKGITVYGGGDLGWGYVTVDVDDEEAAYEILRSVPEFQDSIVTRVKYVPR